MAKIKTPNYTPEQELELREFYLSIRELEYAERTPKLETYAAENGRKYRSIVSKLARMKDADGNDLYVKKVVVSKVSGETAEKKDALAVEIAETVNMFVTDSKRKVNAENLQKLNKLDLLGLRDAFNAVIPDSE